MPLNDDPELPSESARTVVRDGSGTPPTINTPTFPSEAESLLQHLKLGAGQSGPPPTTAPGQFPHIPGYEIECELGRGGMGVVYKARHASLHHTVAIKMILASANALPGEVARFVAEAEAIAAVKHPNVVQVFDLQVIEGPGPDAGRPYFVLEFVDGGNLAALLKNGPLAPAIAAELIEAVARGVHAAHDAGIVHRDLKPGNILLNAECGMRNAESRNEEAKSASLHSTFRIPHSALIPKVSDFGLAKRLSSDITRTQAVMGTPAYMAPEQAGGKAKFVGPQADVYALGVILYQCLTGATPFDDPDPWSLIRRVLDETPPAPRARAPGVPRDLELICLKCLEKEPHHRYPSAAALADDLRRFLNREPVSVRPIGPATRTIRWAKRHPTAAGLVLFGALLAVVVPALVVWQQGRLDRRDQDAAQAHEREEAAQKIADAATRAENEAKLARTAAEQLAEARELFALQDRLRTRATGRPPGWVAANLAELPKAVALARGDPNVIDDLRSDAAVALLADDLLAVDPVARGVTSSALATDPRTGLIAVGEQKARFNCDVLLIDPRTGRTVKTLTYPVKPTADQDGTRSLAFSPNGQYLFVGTRRSSVMQFDLTTEQHRPVRSWEVAKGAIDQLAVSPDSQVVYGVCESEPHVFAWSTDTGKPLKPFVPPDGARVNGIAVLPTGELIAAGGDKLHEWTAAGALVRSVPAYAAGRVAVGPGSVLLVGAQQRLEMYDRHGLAPTDVFTDPALRRSAHEDRVRAIAVHPSGAFAATAASDQERVVKVWELSSGRRFAVVPVAGTGPIAVAWSGDGEHLLATASGEVSRWRFAPAAARQFVGTCGGWLASATFAPNGRCAAVGEPVNGWREVVVGTDRARAHDPRGVEHPGLAVAPDGTVYIATGAGGAVWKPGTPPRAAELAKEPVGSPRLSPDGNTLWAVVGPQTVCAFDPVTLARRGTWDNRFSKELYGLSTIDALTIGRTGAVAGAREGAVYAINADYRATGFRAFADPVLAVAVAPDDSLVAAGTQKGKLRLLCPATRTEHPAVAAHPGGVSAVAINRDGTLLATGGRDQCVRLWKRTGERFVPLLTVPDLPGAVRELHFSPTDDRLLVLLAQEHALRIWDVTRLHALLTERHLGW